MPPARTHFCAVVRAGDGALLLAGEDVLELDHARVGEHQRGVVARNERARGHDLVVVAAEKFEEPGADVFEAGHGNLHSRGRRQNVRGRALVCATSARISRVSEPPPSQLNWLRLLHFQYFVRSNFEQSDAASQTQEGAP